MHAATHTADRELAFAVGCDRSHFSVLVSQRDANTGDAGVLLESTTRPIRIDPFSNAMDGAGGRSGGQDHVGKTHADGCQPYRNRRVRIRILLIFHLHP